MDNTRQLNTRQLNTRQLDWNASIIDDLDQLEEEFRAKKEDTSKRRAVKKLAIGAELEKQRELLLHSRNAQANQMVSKCMRMIIYILVVMWALNFTGVLGLDITAVTLCFTSCALILMIPTLLVDVLNINKPIINYVIILCAVLVVSILSTFLSYYVYAIVLFPLLVASMYSNRKIVIFTAIFNILSTVVSSVLSTYFCLFENMIATTNNVQDALIFVAMPATFIVIAMSIVAFFIVDRNSRMLNEAIDSDLEVKRNQKEMIFAFAEISENKSKMTGEHIKRVAEYMRILGRASGFSEDFVEKLSTASMMHDIGKLMIDEEILDKPSKLTDEEYNIMKSHVLYGYALLKNTTGDIMDVASEIALQHHERWDGKGYLSMRGAEIAYPARLMAVADVFDALMSKRYYKEGWSVQEAYDEIVRGSGTQFDPDVVKLFQEHIQEFVQVLEEIPDKSIY